MRMRLKIDENEDKGEERIRIGFDREDEGEDRRE